MQRYLRFFWTFVCPLLFLLVLVFSTTSCRTVQSAPAQVLAAPCALAFSPQAANQEITQWQLKSQSEKTEVASVSLEQLGWQYIEQARTKYDAGFLLLAEACAACLETKLQKTTPEVLLLRGHALHQMHRFQEAEIVARTLVNTRGLSFDYGLLGDVLMEQGKLSTAIPAYQKMMDLKPNLQAYSRAAHVHWLEGDVKGAIRLAAMAAQAGSKQESEPTAWAYSRLALYELQMGNFAVAENAIRIALEIFPAHAPSLLVSGRIFLAQNKWTEALPPLQRAAALNPLPEYQWTLLEAYRAAGKNAEAETITQALLAKGQQEDPRTFALFLATTKQQPELAVQLARKELQARADIFSQDALAWALGVDGKLAEAQTLSEKSLAAGTHDARLFFHAGSIAAQAGKKSAARQYFQQAHQYRYLLLPSERQTLQQQMAAICGAHC